MKILYFAWVRQKVGKGEEEIPLPPRVSTVADLMVWLKNRGDGYAEVFANTSRLRVAVNQQHAHFEASIDDAAEVAFFPPVTGG